MLGLVTRRLQAGNAWHRSGQRNTRLIERKGIPCRFVGPTLNMSPRQSMDEHFREVA